MDFDNKIATLRLAKDKKIQELNEKIDKGKIKKQECASKKVKIDEEIMKWDNKIKIWENEIKETNDTFYKEIQTSLGLSSDEVLDALISKGREKEKLKDENNNIEEKEINQEIEKEELKNKEEEKENTKEVAEEKGSDLFD